MNLLARKVGIWYHDREWASKIYDEILKNIPSESIAQIRNSRNEMYIKLKDGSYFRFIPTYTSSRGQRLSESYVQRGVSREVYECIICSCTFGEVYIVDKYEDFTFYGRANMRLYEWEEKNEDSEKKICSNEK